MKRLIAFLLLAASAHGADFGDIPASLALPASNSVRRNAANTAFEAYLPSSGGGPFPWGGSETGHGDSNYTILNTDKIVFTNAVFTAARTWTLPAASTVAAGYAISVIDQQGTITTTNLLTIQKAAATSDLIYPPNTSVYIMSTAHQGATFVSDGTSKWYAISVQPGVGSGSSGYFAQTSWTPGVWAASLYTLPVTASGSTGKILQSDGSNVVFSAPTYPAAAGSSGNVLTSNGTNWLSSAPAAGGVSSFAAGDLSPVFTTTEPNVAGAVTLSFSLSTAGAHTFLGNETGSTAAPHYVQPNFTDLAGDFALTQTPSLAASSLMGRGSASGAGDWERITVGSGLSLTGTVLSATAGGGGTVTDFSAGDLSPLFTTTEATTTTTPALSFALTNAAATTVFGRAAGTSGAPIFSASPQFTAIGNLTTNGFVTTSGGTGTLGVNTSTFLTANQPITLTGDVTGGPAATSIATTIANNAVTNADLRDSGPLSVIGRSANTTGDPADISATAASGAVLRESGSTLGFGTIATAGIADGSVTLAKMANMATDSILGRATTGTGVPEVLGSLPFAWSGGDIARAADSNTETINANAVTYAKMQAVSTTSKLLGSSSTTTPVQEITLGTNLSMSGATLNATSGSGGPFPWGGSETGHGDSNYTILNTDKIVYTNAAFTAARTWTLPAASTVTAGYAISIIDRQGTITTTNLLTISRTGADSIYPPNTSSYIMSGPHQGVTFESDGVSKWFAVNVQPGKNASGSNSGAFSQQSWQVGVYAASLYNLPTSIGASGKMLQSNGTDVAFSAPTWPIAAASAGKIIRDNGTNFVETTATYPDTAGTTGNVLTSDGTNWLSSAPAGGGGGNVSNSGTPTANQLPIWVTATTIKGVTGVIGGATGTLLKKTSATDYDWSWSLPSWGGSVKVVGNVDYTILATDRVLVTNAAFTSFHTWTLPAASTVTAGDSISIHDRQGTVGVANFLDIAVSGADTITNPTITSYRLVTQNGGVTFMSDGVSRWLVMAVQPGFSSLGTFAMQYPSSGMWNASPYALPSSIGASGKVLVSDGTNVLFSTPTYPTTAGTSGNVLTSNGTNWVSSAPTGGSSIVRSVAASWQDLSGGVLVAPQAAKLVRTVPYSGTITAWSVSVDSGTATIKWWKKADGSAIPTISDNINTSTGFAVSSGTHARSFNFTGANAVSTTTVTAGDMFVGYLSAVTGSPTAVAAELEITSP